MEITGFDTVIFTNRPPTEIVHSVFASVLKKWPKAKMQSFGSASDEHPPSEIADAGTFSIETLPQQDWWLLFYRDDAMIRHMEEFAYEPMADGDGPFTVIARPRAGVEFRIESLKELRLEAEPDRNIDPYPAWLCSPSLTEVTVVTPDDPETQPFSRWASDMVRRACGGTAIRTSGQS